jgi:DNA polymerase-3 subunit gamma/tau
MSYQVTARKWRPQTFEEVVYQDHISKTLKNSILSGRISHSYLFTGPRGVGKTTTARIFAKSLNCVNGPTPEPCGKCENCIEIKNGTSFDVIEIDGASNRSIDDIRDLRENVNYAPVKAKYKIYIIDEVHMLTKEAFNALLKTLEEPPPHVVFIFATTEYHQVPETILSRCQKYFFRKIPVEALSAQLKKIAEKEGHKISELAVFAAARAAEGSMRDAQSLLDQIISFSGSEEASEEDVLAILGIISIESYIRLLEYVDADNTKGIFDEIERISEIGADFTRFVAGLADIIRAARLIKRGIISPESIGLSQAEFTLLKNILGKFSDADLSAMGRICVSLQKDLKFAADERINIEMALLDMAVVKKTPSISEIINKLDSYKNSGFEKTTVKKADEKPAPEIKKSEQAVLTSKDIKSVWADFLREIQTEKNYLFSLVKQCMVELKGDQFYMIFPGGNALNDADFYSKIIDKNKRMIIEEGISRRLGIKAVLNIKTADTLKKADPAENNPVQEAESSPLPEAEMLKNPETDEIQRKNPTVEKIKDVFHGEIIGKGEK